MSEAPLWIIQTNLGEMSDISKWLEALDAEGIARQAVDVIPFSGELPDIDHNGPVVCYGTTGFVASAGMAKRWSPGVWHNDEDFSYSAWSTHIGDLLLNSPDATIRTTIGGFLEETRPADSMVFVRPEFDHKEFVGQVMTAGEFRDWCATVVEGGLEPLGFDTPIVVGTPFGISEEWRLFIVEGRVVGSSRYRRNGRMDRLEGAPADVLEFAAVVNARWMPAPVYTLDICRSGGGLYVLEAQGFNSAGSYEADLRNVVREVTDFAVRTHVPKSERLPR